jgi:hypothetical protein
VGRGAEVTTLSPEEASLLMGVAEALYDKMIEQQRAKVLRLAREVVPHISSEDVLNPHDYPELKAHPTFEFEDGLLSGLVAAQIALRAEVRRRLDAGAPGVM